MNEFAEYSGPSGGPSTLPPSIRVAGEVDEEPPGSYGQSSPCHHPSLVQQRLWPRVSPDQPHGRPELLRPAPFHGRSEEITVAIAPRPSRCSPRARAFRKAFYRDVTDKQWNDWRWQARSRIRTIGQIEKMLNLSGDERAGLEKAGEILPVATTPYYMSLVSADNALQPLRRTIIPTASEFTQVRGESADPLGEDHDSATPGLVHRYPDRVLLLAVDFCSTYCRYCTRSRVVGSGELVANEARLKQAFEYIRSHTEIRDCLISGGDPLSLSDDRLDWILTNLRSIPHLEFIRIGTKMPAVLPMRISRELCKMLRKHHPLWMSIHFTHPDECTPEAYQACARLADSGIPLGSQTVLLRGINDNVPTMKSLMHNMLKNARAAVLSLSVRPDHRFPPLPHPGLKGPGDHRRPAGPHDRLRRAYLRH